ncbi:bifunctional folylpolyglutamate synthase/dihydrofolate synthase [Lactococcus insecticola]|uniref:tetrahydrofolate synthase n=1 Tax=Pseudolactococcus insecticola TaxID=2709158 RepID=A0A6A0B3S9_9LACT|nr:folylpolyglutamate synthase/dihydrofolate synthase family protein [Lactococcus insecticola]GFH39999.1 tetrahydrofolate synthase [Lactococcus insecticola]
MSNTSIDWIHSRLKFGIKPGVTRIVYLLKQLGNPQNKLKTVHVAGTNGKGSTVTFLSNILQQYGLRVGTFTSPYIEVFNERIAINGRFISDDELDRVVAIIKPLVLEMDMDSELVNITEFEILTAIGFLYFQQEAVDIAVIEVGLGGLYDSTNVITPLVSAIVTIGMDHQDILGDTLTKISGEKAGIIKPNVPVIVGNQVGVPDDAFQVIEAKAKSVNAPIFRPLPDSHEKFDLSLHGQYQQENAALALKVFDILAPKLALVPDHDKVAAGLKQAFWPARMEALNGFILDGAHNIPAIKRLITEFDGSKKVNILFSALQRKDFPEMIELLKTIPNMALSLTTFDYPKTIRQTDVAGISDVTWCPDWRIFLSQERASDEIYLVTGSLYFMSQVRAYLLTNH